MAFALMDDQIFGHPKFARAGLEAVGLWTLCYSWSGAYGTNGLISREAAATFARGQLRGEKLAGRLVECGLWSRTESGYQMVELYAFRSGREPIDEGMRQMVLARDGWMCGLCGGPIEGRSDLHIDHVIPVARGGRTLLSNLQPAHAICNLRKGANG